MGIVVGSITQNGVLQSFTSKVTKYVKPNDATGNYSIGSFKNIIESSTNNSLEEMQETNSDNGFFSKILKFLGRLFNGNNAEKRSGIEIPIKNDGICWYAEEPDTPEFKAHNEYMDAKKAEWIKNHPEPEFNPYAFCLNDPHLQWEKEMQEYLNNLESTYREENPEYKAQALDYEDAKRQASLMM